MQTAPTQLGFEDRRHVESVLKGLPGRLSRPVRDAIFKGRLPDDPVPISQELAQWRTDCNRIATDCLDHMSASCALDETLIRKASEGNVRTRSLHSLGSARFIWVIAVRAHGTSRELRLVKRYMEAAAGWIAGNQAYGLFAARDPFLSMGVALNSDFENTRRNFTSAVHFSWIAQYIAETACRVAAVAGFDSRELPDEEVIREILDYVKLLIQPRRYVPAHDLSRLSDQAIDFLRRVSLDPRSDSLGMADFSTLVTSSRLEQQPCVLIDGNPTVFGVHEFLFGIDQVVLEAARSAGDKKRADLFEAVARACLGELGPRDLQVVPPPLAIPIPGSENPGEVDVAASTDSLVLLGECKAQLVTPQSSTVINAFTDQVGKAVHQLAVRRDALDAGAPLLASGVPVPLNENPRILAVALTLHSYGGAVWNADSLREISAIERNIAVVPLHQFVIVAHALRNATELDAYFQFRQQILEIGVVILDEIDIMTIFLHPHRDAHVVSMRRQAQTGRVITQPLIVPMGLAMSLPKPPSRAKWNDLLIDLCARHVWNSPDYASHTARFEPDASPAAHSIKARSRRGR